MAAAEYFLVVNTEKDFSDDLRVVRLGSQPWISLKGSVDEAIKRYTWRWPRREALEGEVGMLQLFRFTLTHVGMSAYYLGYLRFELRGWRQSSSGTWSTFEARFRGDLPMQIVVQGEELWKAEEVPMPDVVRLLELHDAVHGAVTPGV